MPTTAPSTPPKIEKTGKKETIAGYACDVWNITSEGKRSEVCMAEGLSWIDMSDLGMGSPEIAVAVAAIASEGPTEPTVDCTPQTEIFATNKNCFANPTTLTPGGALAPGLYTYARYWQNTSPCGAKQYQRGWAEIYKQGPFTRSPSCGTR